MAAMERSDSRWWRVTVEYRGRILEDRRFDAGRPVLVGEGGPALVLPGVASGALVRGGAVQALAGLERVGVDERGVHELRVFAAPEVRLRVVAESGPRPAGRHDVRLPWRELAYGTALAGCLAAFVLREQYAAAHVVPAGASDTDTGRMARAMRASSEDRSPVVATFVAGPQPLDARAEAPSPRRVAAAESKRVAPVVEGDPSETVIRDDEEPSSRPRRRTRRRARSSGLLEAAAPPEGDLALLRERGSDRREWEDVIEAVDVPHTLWTATPFTEADVGVVDGSGGGGVAVLGATCDDPERAPAPNVDVVFVIDVSTTMAFALDRLADEIVALDASVRRHDADRRYGLVLFVDDVLVVDGNPYTDAQTLRADFRRWARFTSTNRQLRSEATNVDWPENGLDALGAAVRSFAWRDAEDTLRLVVYASDDDFGEAGDVQSGQAVHGTYDGTLRALKRAQIRVASFTAPIGGQCECEDVRAGFMADHRGRPAIPVATGGAAFNLDEVAAGRLTFERALSPLIDGLVCS
jgi:hypothetical protein